MYQWLFTGLNGLRESASTPRSTASGYSTVRSNINVISPLSRYLVIPSASSNANINRKMPKASLAELEEKECNKKLAAEEKERKKTEREEKRKQKQELLEEKKRQREENARKRLKRN